jgi:hypothetical protein
MKPVGAHVNTRVKIPSDVLQLTQWYFVKLEPPYWYLRCCHCGQRQYLPWDERLRTETALATLIEHGSHCAS